MCASHLWRIQDEHAALALLVVLLVCSPKQEQRDHGASKVGDLPAAVHAAVLGLGCNVQEQGKTL